MTIATAELLARRIRPVQVAIGDTAGKVMDVVYTWVDDSFDGYAETLAQYARVTHDRNPNRTRDNLDLLKYSMRSLEAYLPEVKRVWLVTCRPQVPAWLDTERADVRVVHHDEIMSPDILPTFNSFAIVSHLHLLPDLGARFLYFEDDCLLMRKGLLDSMSREGRHLAFRGGSLPRGLKALNPEKDGPWSFALEQTNALLADRYGGQWPELLHGPRLIDKDRFAQMCAQFPDVFERTKASRFRGLDNVPPEQFYPHYMVAEGAADIASEQEKAAFSGYAALTNSLLLTRHRLRGLARRRPASITLNDDFNHVANPRVERFARRWLEREFPTPSRFER